MAVTTGTGHGVEWYTAEQVLNGFDNHTKDKDNVYYSIWQGKSLRFGYNEGSINTGRDILEENLQPLVYNGNTSTYTIKFHPMPDASGYITDKTPIMGSFNFKVSDPYSVRMAGVQQPTAAPMPAPRNDDKIDKILELLIAQDQRIKALEEEPDFEFDEEPEPDQKTQILGQVQQVEQIINESPLLNDVYTHLRLGLRVLAKRFGVEPETSNYTPGSYNIAGMEQQQQQHQQQPEQELTFTEMFGLLVKQFPELPNMLGKLYNLSIEDNDMFRVVKKKLIDGVNSI